MELISFNINQVEEILELIGEDLTKVKNCETCGQELSFASIGFIARGDNKNLLFCGKGSCFSHMVAKKFPDPENDEYNGDCNKHPHKDGICQKNYDDRRLKDHEIR